MRAKPGYVAELRVPKKGSVVGHTQEHQSAPACSIEDQTATPRRELRSGFGPTTRLRCGDWWLRRRSIMRRTELDRAILVAYFVRLLLGARRVRREQATRKVAPSNAWVSVGSFNSCNSRSTWAVGTANIWVCFPFERLASVQSPAATRRSTASVSLPVNVSHISASPCCVELLPPEPSRCVSFRSGNSSWSSVGKR